MFTIKVVNCGACSAVHEFIVRCVVKALLLLRRQTFLFIRRPRCREKLDQADLRRSG